MKANPCETDLVYSMVLTLVPPAPALLAAALAVVMGVQTKGQTHAYLT